MAASNVTTLAERVAAIGGPGHVIHAPDRDVGGVRPAVAVAPGTCEEAAQILLAAREAGAAVTAWGGGTQQRIGAPPVRLDLVLETGRLARIVEWEPADLTGCFEAGITLAAAQAALAEHGQQIPVDVPVPERATLGGLVATNTAGPRRWQYGGWRDLVIGMHVALPDGTVIKSGGRVVKNVQGYDLAKLYTGSLGTLGVIVQVNLKLVPLPAARRLIAARGHTAAVCRFLNDVAASTARVSTVDMLDEPAARVCGLGDGVAGLVLIEGPATVVDAQSALVSRTAAGVGLRPDAVESDALDAVRHAWVDLGRVDDLGPGEALLTVSALPGEVAGVLDALRRDAEAHGLSGTRWARAGNGLVYARCTAGGQSAAAAFAAAQAELLARWPATTLVAGDPEVEKAARPWGAEPAGLSVMRALKQRFDPAGVLQPGRYVGGI